MEKAVFLDRDGTINVEKHYIYKIEDFEFLPGALEGLRLLQDAGYLLIIITNQSGIGRGYYTEDDFWHLNEWMVDKMKETGIRVNKIYYCPHHPDACVDKYRMTCMCRKPSLGMYKQAIADFNINIARSWAIGDKIRDCAICNVSKCKGFLIGNSENDLIIKAVKSNLYKNIRYACSLKSAAEKVLESDVGRT